METLLSEPIDLELVASLCAAGIERMPSAPRDKSKWHVTSLFRAGKSIVKGNVRYSDSGESELEGAGSMGKIWEAAIDCYLQHYAVQRGGFYTPDVESVRGDIVGSLDGVMFLPGLGWMVCETKLRFTLKEDIPLDHTQQIKAYCCLVGTDLACYVCGHLSSTPPTVRASLSIFRLPRLAIAETWEGIVNTKAYLISQGCSPTDGAGS